MARSIDTAATAMEAEPPKPRATSLAWILSCVFCPLGLAILGAALVAIGTSNNTTGLRVLGAICLYTVIIGLTCLFAACVDKRILQPAFWLPQKEQLRDKEKTFPSDFLRTAGLGFLWLFRLLGVLDLILVLIGIAPRLTSLSRSGSPEAASEPVSDPPAYATIGQAAVGPLSQLLWTWVLAELLLHLWLLGKHCYEKRQRQKKAATQQRLTGGTSTNPVTTTTTSSAVAPPPSTATVAVAAAVPSFPSAPPGLAGVGNGHFGGQGVPVASLMSSSSSSSSNTGFDSSWGTIPGQSTSTAIAPLEMEGGTAAAVVIRSRSSSTPSSTADASSSHGRKSDGGNQSDNSKLPAYYRYAYRSGKTKVEEAFPGMCCNWVPCPCVTPFCNFCCFEQIPRWAALLIVVLVSALSITGFAIGYAAPTVFPYQVKLARLPPQAEGFRIGVLADLHVGSAVGATRLQVPVAQVLAQKPHLVVLSGDLMDSSELTYAPAWDPLRAIGAACNSSSPAAVAAIQRLLTSTARGAAGLEEVCIGAFASLGNHDGDGGTVQGKVDLLESMGITVLTNDRVSVPSLIANVPASSLPAGLLQFFDLIGVSDFSMSGTEKYQIVSRLKPLANVSSTANMAKACEGRDSSKELVVLAHQPRHASMAASVGGGLMLSGHTHGGQIFPVIPLSGVANDGLVAGLYTYERAPTDPSNPQALQVAVNRGTFQYGLSFRHRPSEVSLVVLQAP